MQDDPLLSMEGLIATLDRVAVALEKVALHQEQMVMVAMEAREERLKLSNQLKERMKAGFAQEKP